MRKPTICIGENKAADQLRGNCEADQRLCFRYTDSKIPLLSKSLTIFCDCTYVSHLVGNPKCWFSPAKARFSWKFSLKVGLGKDYSGCNQAQLDKSRLKEAVSEELRHHFQSAFVLLLWQ